MASVLVESLESVLTSRRAICFLYLHLDLILGLNYKFDLLFVFMLIRITVLNVA